MKILVFSSTKRESGLQRIKTQSAFTLVELIVVITIVGILSTIGFVAYSGYLGGARDGNRMASLTKLSDSLQTYAAAKSLPLPDDAINIDASGTTIAYQGYVGENVLETIDFTNGGKDPKDDSYYTYYLTKERKKLQLLTFLEEQTAFYNSSLNSSPRNLIPTFSLGGEGASYKENSVASLSSQEREFKGEVLKELKREQTASLPLLGGERIQGGGVKRVGFVQKSFASDYSNRYPKTYGQKLGVLISSESATKNTPAQEISANINAGKVDVVTTNSGYTAMIDEDESITGTGILISQYVVSAQYNKYSSCDEIYDNFPVTRKINAWYNLQIDGKNVKVFCDMSGNYGFIKYFSSENELVAGYNFENNLSDFSKNANNGSITLGSATYSNGAFQNAILFSGSLMNVPNSSSLNFTTNQYTFSFWVNFSFELPSQNLEWPTLINKRPWCTSGYIFGFQKSQNRVVTHICESGSAKGLGSGPLPSLAGKWSHFLTTYDGTTFKLYLNGEMIASQSFVNPQLTHQSGNMGVGGDYQGMIDSLRIYNRALSESEIQALYREG